MSENIYPASLPKIQNTALVVGLVGAIACVIFWLKNPPELYHSYLMAYVFWLGIALGSLAILKIQHLTGGGWGFVIRRVLEAAAGTLPFLFILFIPIILGMKGLYSWADPAIVATDHILREKSKYLNVNFFLVRLVIYFLIWSTMAFLLRKWSLEQDKTSNQSQALNIAAKCRQLSAPGLIIIGLTMTFAAVDWVMSLEAHWVSTIFGLLTLGGQLLSAYAFSIIIVTKLAKEKPVQERLHVVYLHDLGKLMMAFVLLWSYFSLSQLLIIWSGNLPEETIWYLHREQGGWQYIGVGLILFYFALPFFILIPRNNKRRAERISKIAMFILFMRMVDLFWSIKPNLNHGRHGFEISLSDFAAPIALGGIWLFLFFMNLRGRPLLPQRDPYIKETPVHGH